MKKRIAIVFILFLLHILKCEAQDPSFSQFYPNKLFFNPAFCGLSGSLNLSLSQRILMPKIPSKFNTSKFSLDAEIPRFGGCGLIGVYDVEGEGALKTFTVGIPISVNPSIFWRNRTKGNPQFINFQAGFLISMINKSINFNNLIFSDQLDAISGVVRNSSFAVPQQSSTIFPDFAAGIIMEHSNEQNKSNFQNTFSIRAGAAWFHIFRPSFSFLGLESRLPDKKVFHINSVIKIAKAGNLYISPAVIYENQSSMNTILAGSDFMWRFLNFGTWYRNFYKAEALTFVAGINWNLGGHISKNSLGNKATRNIIFFSYSFDITMSRLSTASAGSHEINISYKFNSPPKRKKKMGCPSFNNYNTPF